MDFTIWGSVIPQYQARAELGIVRGTDSEGVLYPKP